MARPVTVSEAQDQLLETALNLYRMVYRLHRQREGLRIPYEIECACNRDSGDGSEPPTIAIAVAEEIGATIDEFQEIADRLQRAARSTDASIRRQWRQQRQECAQ